MKDSDAHAHDASASATKAALEAMKEFKTNPTNAKAKDADKKAKVAEITVDMCGKGEYKDQPDFDPEKKTCYKK